MVKVKPHHVVALIITAIVAILVLVHVVGIARRNAQYRAVLKSYSDVLKPGTKRGDVENYFTMSRYVSFNRGASQDTVDVAREGPGWVCKDQLVYLVFEFDRTEPSKPEPTDRLVRISLDRSLCLDLP